MNETQRQPARLKRSAASRRLIEAGGDMGAGGEFCERSPFSHPINPTQRIARPSALSQIAERVAAGALLTLLCERMRENTSRARHDEICSAYWRAIDNIEITRGRLN